MEKLPENELVVLVHRYLSGGMEAPEKQAFEQRLRREPELAKLHGELSLIWAASAQFSVPQFDGQQAYRSFAKRTHKARKVTWYVSAAAVILLVVLGGVYLLSRNAEMRDLVAQAPVKEVLEDGSSLSLRTNAHLRIPETFSGSVRKVQMVSGEAFFDIASDTKRPFVITHKWGEVKVVGTEFIISLDTTAHEFTIHVLEGEVTFTPNLSDNVARIRAGEGLRFDGDTRIIERLREENPNAISWHTGVLTFVDTPLKTVVEELKHHYQLQITLEDETLGDCLFTSPLPYQNAKAKVILDALCTTFGMQLKETSSNEYVLSGGQCQ